MATQSIIVPRISSFPGHERKAQQILRWLAKRDIVEALPTTCGRSGMAYAIAPGASRVVAVSYTHLTLPTKRIV